jgi:PAS domain S-box-containing protein
MVTNDLLKIAGFLISYLAIIGYIYNFEVVYKVGAFMPMALNTAVGYISFFTVSLIEMPPGTFMKVVGSGLVGGRMARRAIPLVLVLPMAFGYLRIMGEQALLFSPSYGTALQSAFMVLLVLIFVFLYARRLNIQDKKRLAAELQIAESERKYRTLVYALREGVVYYDTKGIISFCNRSFCELSGYSEDEIKGKSVFDFFVKEEQKEKYRALLENRDDIKSEIYEENVRTRHGDNIWVSISARPVCNDAGDMIAALSTIVDITEKKKQMEDIEAFSASAAHDINAPLARIEMIAMLLIESTEGLLDEESLSLLQAIAGITSNMRSLLKDLLQFSKLGVTNIEKHDVDTGLLVKEVIEASRHINPKAKIKVNPIPTVFADKAMLKQVYTNLISNALKYSGNKEEPVVEIGSEHNNNNTVLYVKDNGAGFDMKEAEKLFAAFQRLHYEFEGNGLKAMA